MRQSQFFVAFILAAISGAALLYHYPFPVDDPFVRILRLAPGPHALLRFTYPLFFFTTPLIVYFAALSLYFVHIHKTADDGRRSIKLPPFEPPLTREKLFITIGEVHNAIEKKPVPNPTWLDIPEKGLYTGIACFGAIGSGKTSSLIRPAALQLFSYAAHDPERRLGGIILEVKGDFCHQVRTILQETGRGEDYVEISLDTNYRYNPLANKDLDEDALAYAITTLIANIYGKGKDPFWPMASTNAMKFLILLHRLLYDYATLLDVYQAAINPALAKARLDEGARLFGLSEDVIVSGETFGTNAQYLATFDFATFEDGGTSLRAEVSPKLKDVLHKHAIPFELRTVRQESPDIDPSKQAQFEAVIRWYTYDWSSIDVKLRTSIVEGISVFLSLFDTNPAIKRIFCPPKATFDPAQNPPPDYPMGEPFPPFADLIENGKVVALNFPVSLNPTVAKTVGTLMKLDYQRAVLLRIPKMAASEQAKDGKHFRPTAFIVDEYQNFATVGETGTGDQNFFSLSRQPKCIGIVATQSVVSLKSAIGSDEGFKTLLQTFRTKIFLNLSDDVSAKLGSELCGKENRVHTSYNISESTQDAGVSLLGGRTVSRSGKGSVSTSKSFQTRLVERFPVKAFIGLKNAQAIVIGFDGVNPIAPTLCYLKPYWLDPNVSWWEQYEQGLLG